MAAAVREEKSPFDHEALREVERYAAREYLQDALRGERDSAAVERITARITPLTGLIRRLCGGTRDTWMCARLRRERSHGCGR